MPPKEKAGKKGKGKPKPMIIDGVDTSNMSRDQLEQFTLRLKEEMEREREERNFFQVERDKIRTFWEIARDKAQELTAELLKKERELEEIQHLNEVETKEKTQQMKYIQYENANKINDAKVESMARVKIAQEENLLRELEILKDKRELRRLLRESEQAHELQMQQSKMESMEEIQEVHTQYKKEIEELKVLNEEKMTALKSHIDLVYRMQMFEIEERKNTHINRLMANHDVAFNNMKNYYSDITLNNLSLITALKQQIETLQHQADKDERLVATVTTENTELKEQLEVVQQEVLALRRKLEFYERDKAQLARIKSRNASIQKELKGLTSENESLLLRNDTLIQERETLKTKYNEALLELQQKTNRKNVLLESKITVLEKETEKQELKVKDTLNKCKERLISCGTQTKDIHIPTRSANILEKKEKIIHDLKYELSRVTKSHDDLLAAYESILSQYDIPKDELGFEPLRLTSNWKYIEGPAGLVTKNK